MRIRNCLAALAAMFCLAGWAATPAWSQELAGTWQGKLQVDPKTVMTIQFTFAKKADGSYSAVLNSPDNGALKNVSADSVSLKAGAVSVQVAALSGGFDGTLSAGSISGHWKQPGGTLPLVLSPYQRPVFSKAALDTLVGSWNGPISAGGNSMTFVAQFKVDDKGALQGTLAVPEQGGRPLDMADIQFADSKLTFKIPIVSGEFNGALANGAFNGLWRQGNPLQPPEGVPVVLKKGEFVAKVQVLKLSAESFGKLAGSWTGELNVPGPNGEVVIPVVLRFETNQQAAMVGFWDVPSQGAKGIPVSEASLEAGKLVIKVPALNSEYDANLSGNTLSGQMSQGPGSYALTLTRK